MTSETFMYLVRELEPFVKSRATMFVRAPFELRKAIGLVLYQLAYGVSANIIIDRFNVGASTTHKYVDIIVNVLISRDKLFSQYISILHGPCLLRIMDGFFIHVVILMSPIFCFPKSRINELLQYLQIIIVGEKVVI
jgi:hypothetical protein